MPLGGFSMRILILVVSAMSVAILSGCDRPVQSAPMLATVQSIADSRTLFLGAGAPDSLAIDGRRDSSLSVRTAATEFDRDAWNAPRPADVSRPTRVRVSIDATTYMFFSPRTRGSLCDR